MSDEELEEAYWECVRHDGPHAWYDAPLVYAPYIPVTFMKADYNIINTTL